MFYEEGIKPKAKEREDKMNKITDVNRNYDIPAHWKSDVLEVARDKHNIFMVPRLTLDAMHERGYGVETAVDALHKMSQRSGSGIYTVDRAVAEIREALADDDIEKFHQGETTPDLDKLFQKFGIFQIWGSRTGIEPLSIII